MTIQGFGTNKKALRLAGVSALALAWAAGCAGAVDEETTSEAEFALSTTTVFQDGQLPTTSYAGTRDTMLEGASPNTTNGSDTSLSVDGDGDQEALLSWDVSASIPTTAIVESATITLVVSDKSPETFTFYEAKPAWNESQATWNVYATSSSWQAPGGTGTNDRGTAALGSFSAPNNATYTITLNAAGIALVQSWVSNPTSNHGVFLDGPTTTNRLEFRASEYGTKASRPKLSVTWSDGSGGGTGGSGSGGSGSGGTLNGAWFGQNSVVTVDGSNVFGTNLSGLVYEPGTPSVLWAVQNGPEKLYRLLWNGSIWTSDTSNSWTSGKTLRYPSGTGAPDSEGVPGSMSNLNNEGIAFAPESECSGGFKSFFWTDDDGTSGHSIRRDSIPCGHFF